MKTIALTQRIEYIKNYGESRSSLDQQYFEWLFSCGYKPLPLPMIGEPDQYLEGCGGVLLTGGGDVASVVDVADNRLRDAYESKIIAFALERRLPLFGICRGLHSLNDYFGGTFKRIANHVRIRHNVSFANGEERDVNSYHNYGVDRLAKEFNVVASHGDSVEMIEHETLPIKAIMWHPEREQNFNLEDKEIITEVMG